MCIPSWFNDRKLRPDDGDEKLLVELAALIYLKPVKSFDCLELIALPTLLIKTNFGFHVPCIWMRFKTKSLVTGVAAAVYMLGWCKWPIQKQWIGGAGLKRRQPSSSGLEGVSKTNDEEKLKHNTLSSGLMEHNTKK
jgi:hypothetical protein